MSIWGKVIGGVTGFAVGGPIGAIIGAVAGHHVLDKSKSVTGKIGNEERQIAFTTAVIILSAKMAKADGHVTRDEVDAFKEVFHIPPGEAHAVGQVFDQAKASADGFEPYAEQISQMFSGDWNVLEQLLGALFHIAKADGHIHPEEVRYLHGVALLFGFSDRDFQRIQTIHLSGWGGEGGRAQKADDAYEILGVGVNASDDEVKSTYRNLVRENHPDVLTAKGLPQEFIDLANDKLATINDAYDRIKKQRGFN